MYSYKEVERSHKIIKDFAMQYRKELTVFQGTIAEQSGMMSCSDYVKFMNKLSCDEIVGNLLGALTVPDATKLYKQILDGKASFDIILDKGLSEYAKLIYNENISK